MRFTTKCGKFVCYWYPDRDQGGNVVNTAVTVTVRVNLFEAHITIPETFLQPLPDGDSLVEFLNNNLEKIYVFCKENKCFALEPAEYFSASYELRSCDERAVEFIGNMFKISRIKSAR